MYSTALVLSNKKLLINIDYNGVVKDLYYPNVGEENQLSSNTNPLFFYVDNAIVELNKENFTTEIEYLADSSIGEVTYTENAGRFKCKIVNVIFDKETIFFRHITLTNLTEKSLEIKIVFQNNFSLLENSIGDTVIWYQPEGFLWHYKKKRHIAIGSNSKFYQMTCAAKSDNSGKGAIPNSKGELDFNPVSTGDVSSCISFFSDLGAKSNDKHLLFYCFAKNKDDLVKLVKKARKTNPNYLIQKQEIASSQFLDDFVNIKNVALLSKKFTNQDLAQIVKDYQRSILILHSQTNNNGLVTAGNDGQFLKTDGKDHYSYFWPRDGAFVADALLTIKDMKLFSKVVDASMDLLNEKGFFYHKYLPSAKKGTESLGSTWHSYISESGEEILPIQQDATNIWLFELAKYLKLNNSKEILNRFAGAIKKMVKFSLRFNFKTTKLSSNITEYSSGFNGKPIVNFKKYNKTALPLPSYDIWEQYYGIFSYNALLLYFSLKNSLKILSELGENKLEKEVTDYLIELKNDIQKYLIHDGKFIKGIRYCRDTVSIIEDLTSDSNLYLIATMDIENDFDFTKTIEEYDSKLFIQNHIGGVARKENDHYLKVSDELTGNPWFLSTMWRGRLALKNGDFEFAKKILLFVMSHFDSTGLISEQIDPLTGYCYGIKPLTWSHAEYIIFVKSFVKYLKTISK